MVQLFEQKKSLAYIEKYRQVGRIALKRILYERLGEDRVEK
jgi:hypothetical protein